MPLPHEFQIIKVNFDGGLVSFEVDGQNTPPVSEAKFLDQLWAKRNPKIGLLPPVVRWLSPSRRQILLERPPMTMTFTYHAAKQKDVAGAKEHIIQLPIPWTCYAIELAQDTYYPVS